MAAPPLALASSSSKNGEPTTETAVDIDSATNINNRNTWRDLSYDFSNDKSTFNFTHPTSSKMAESPNHSPVSPNQVQLSFNDNRRSGDETMSCSPSRSLHRQSSLMRMKPKSRLLDPPEKDGRSPRMVKSGVIGYCKASDIDDDDDPFLDDDLPQEFKKIEFSKWSVLQFCSLVLIVAAFISTLTITSLKRKSLYGLQLWRWELLVLVLISGRLVSGWVIRGVVYFVELNFLLRKRVLYFVYGLRNAVQNCIWLALVLIAWHFIFDDKVNRVTDGVVLPYVTKSWVCLLVATLIWLVKTLFVKVLASSFHVSTFFDRIQESLFNQYVIERLSGQPLIEIRQEEEEERLLVEVQKFQNVGATVSPRTGKAIRSVSYSCIASSQPATSEKSPRYSTLVTTKNEDWGITIDHLHRFNQKNISAWNMKRLMNIVRHGALATLDEQILQDSTGEDETEVQISNEFQANTAAKKIFYNVAKPHSKYIYLEDLVRFMREDEAQKMVCLFEGASESKGISKKDLKDWVVNAFTERRALALSLNDTKTAVNKLHQMLNVVVGIIVVVIWLLIFKVATTHFIVFLSSQLLLVVFVFGNTCKTTFEAIIFLFVMHPFDVGDRCEVDGVQMVVEEMNILTTIFLRFDNQKISYPNSVLATKPISNYYRSPDMGDAIDFCVHISTPVEKIALMKKRINSFIENKSDHWHPAPMIVLRDMEDLNRLKVSIWLSHKMNFQNMGERWVRRGVLVEEIIKVFRELDIEYRMLPLDVNVRNITAMAASRVPSNWTACA